MGIDEEYEEALKSKIEKLQIRVEELVQDRVHALTMCKTYYKSWNETLRKVYTLEGELAQRNEEVEYLEKYITEELHECLPKYWY